MGFVSYIEGMYKGVKQETLAVYDHPANVAIGFGDRSIGLIYYYVHLGFAHGGGGKYIAILILSFPVTADILNATSDRI